MAPAQAFRSWRLYRCAMAHPRAGDRIGGFVILRELGAGGMGVVFLARDETLQRDLALKILGSADPRLLEEARLAASLEHPAIVSVYAAGEDAGHLYLAMRYVAGGTLAHRLAADAPDPAASLALLAPIADALDTAHGAGLVHGDVKPGNILLDGDRAQLADFGLARRRDALAPSLRDGIMPGTIGYLAPEQIEGDPVDGRADQYALACVAFECLTGSQPFARDSDVATIYAHLADPVPRASALRPFPPAADDVLARGLAKRAADRFADCAAFVAALRSALAGQTAGTITPSSPSLASGGDSAPLDDALRRRLATMIFCDPSRSTELGDGLDAETLREFSLRSHAEMLAAVTAHGGTIERSVGEAVVALFGIPTANEDDALRAIRAALEMRRRLELLDDEFGRRFGLRLEVHIGINTGEVAARAGGDEPRATGSMLNVARRLEESAASGEILIGHLTHRLVRDAVTVEPVPDLQLKGVARAYRVLALADSPAAIPRRLRSELVGRRPQLAALQEVYRACRDTGRAQTVVLVGEPGVGKGRIAYEFGRTAPEATFLHGRCLSYGDAITYQPLADAIRQAVAAGGDPSSDLRERIHALVPDDPAAAEFLAVVAGVSPAPASPEEIAWAARTLLATLARSAPVVLVLDDLQWAEPTLLELVASLGAVEAPVVLLGLARPEVADLPAWHDGEGGRTQLAVERLTDVEAAELVRGLLSPDIGAPLVARLTEAAGGNPLFLEELCEMLVDAAADAPAGDGGPAPVEALPDALPVTVDALVTSRLDRLPDVERFVIETAAVEGAFFTRAGVAALAPPAVRDRVDPAIDALVRRDLARPTTVAGEPALRFRHLLVRDVTYRGIAKARRADAHAAFARWLESADDQFESVGYHLEQACRYRTELGADPADLRTLGAAAALWLERAAGRARTLGDGGAAVKLLRRAAGVLPDDGPERGRVLIALGAALTDGGELADARAALHEAGALAASVGDPGLAARLDVEDLILDVQLDPGPAIARAAAATDVAATTLSRAGDDEGLGRLAYLVALVRWIEGQVAAAESSWVRAAEIARRRGDTASLSDALRVAPVSGAVRADASGRRDRALHGGARRAAWEPPCRAGHARGPGPAVCHAR